MLEAAEYLLARGRTFRRTAYLAFGDDEETLNTGALAISDHLKAQGVTLEFVLDEGGGKIESGAAFGAPDISIAQVDLMEKGYADLELTVHSVGGHSSRPPTAAPRSPILPAPSRTLSAALPRAAQSRHDGRL